MGDEHDNNPLPARPNGWTLAEARLELVREPYHALAAKHRGRGILDVWNWKEEERQLDAFWRDVVLQLKDGTLVIRGFVHGDILPTAIPLDFVESSEPDFDRNFLRSNGVTFAFVRIVRQTTAATASVGAVGNINDVSHVGARTGIAGRPTSKHLILPELHRRAAAGKLAPTKMAEARALIDWLLATHPTMPVPTAKALAQSITDDYRRLILNSRKSNTTG